MNNQLVNTNNSTDNIIIHILKQTQDVIEYLNSNPSIGNIIYSAIIAFGIQGICKVNSINIESVLMLLRRR